MKPRIIPFVILFAIATTTSGSDDNSYSALSRLHLAMQVGSFPTPIDGKIALWIQETPKSGRLRVADIDHWPASATSKFFNVSDLTHDLSNTVIISNKGKQVRLVDPHNKDINATRGDVVAILLNAKAE